jgi:predicted nucleotidyltransferase
MLLVDGTKAMHGMFREHHYFIRAVLEWNEIHDTYGDCRYSQVGRARARCTVTDDRDGLFTPCRYEIADVEFLKGDFDGELREIVSFRGRFTEQVRQGEKVIVQGSVELVECGNEKWGRFVLGNHPTDILLPSNVL